MEIYATCRVVQVATPKLSPVDLCRASAYRGRTSQIAAPCLPHADAAPPRSASPGDAEVIVFARRTGIDRPAFLSSSSRLTSCS